MTPSAASSTRRGGGEGAPADYEARAARWRREHENRPRAEGGGNYYATKASYLGETFLRLAFGRYYQGAISIQQLADFLNVRVSRVSGLEQLFLQKAAAASSARTSRASWREMIGSFNR